MSQNEADGSQRVVIYDGAGHKGTGGNVAAGATDSGNPVKVGGVYNSSPPTLTTGQRGDLQLDSNGNAKVTLGTKIAGEDQTLDRLKTTPSYSYRNLAANATTTVKSGAGVLHAIVVNTAGGSANTCTIYDNTAGSGTKIGTINTTAFVTAWVYNAAFATGLTIVMATGTAADITVVYL